MWWRADMQGRWYGLASVTLAGVGSVTVVRAKRQGRWSCLATVLLVGVGLITVVTGQKSGALFLSRLCFFGRRGLSFCGSGPIDKGVGLVSPLFLW
jgi:hypothetical protein